MERILVIEDDGALRKILWRLFSSEGYEVDDASDAVCGLERLRQGVPAEVVLDLPRPGSSGLRTHWYAWHLSLLGRYDEGIAEIAYFSQKA